MKVTIHQDISLKAPILLAGWPGMGNVGLGAIDYLRRKLGGVLFAKVDVSPYVMPEAVVVKNGIARLPHLPSHAFFYVPDPALIIYEGETQLSGTEGIALANAILDLAQRYQVQTSYTGAAFAVPISHRERVRVFGVATHKPLRDALPHYGAEIMSEGHISGLNGVFLGLAALRGLEAACFLATMPQYAINFPNPKSSGALIGVFERILNLRIDKTELEEDLERAEEFMAEIEEKIRAVFSSLGFSEEGPAELNEEQAPHYVMEKIERMFQEAKGDRNRAIALKEELDKWGLYEMYEDRFLDLFR